MSPSSQTHSLENLKVAIRTNEALKKHCTLKIGGPALFFALPRTVVELCGLLEFARDEDLRVDVFGAGSNILFSDQGFSGLLISLKQFEQDHIVFREGEAEVSSGVANARLVRLAQERNLGGLEFLAHIPGTIGGACKMNAGFSLYKRVRNEMANVVKQITVMDYNGQIRIFDRSYLQFSYRHLELEPGIITYVVLKLVPRKSEEVERELKEIAAYRKNVQDGRYPSAGSMFKNPFGVAYTSGQLIDMAGLKGRRIGNAQISDKHANFFLNRGGATARDMLTLADLARSTVKERFGVDLEMEVEYVE